jgi:putative oxidoreductase
MAASMDFDADIDNGWQIVHGTPLQKESIMQWIVLLGRILFSAIFIMGGLGHFSKGAIDYAAGQGVPAAMVLVPLAGIISLLGGLSVLLGYRARIGAWLMVIFLVPVTFLIHRFWGLDNQAVAELQQIMFWKNMALVGAALLIAYFGSGPLSLDKDKRKK